MKLIGQAGQVQVEGLLSQVERGWDWHRSSMSNQEESDGEDRDDRRGLVGGMRKVWLLLLLLLFGLMGDVGGV